MISERADKEQPSSHLFETANERESDLEHTRQESSRAALALLLGPETNYHLRVRATRRLARQGPSILPILLTTLSNYPEITSPSWPWWPPQYEHCSRLLVHFSQRTQMRLDAMLQHPVLTQPAGPVLWTSVIEAAGLLPHEDYEALLCRGLETPWTMVRYAAAMALATRAGKGKLQNTTIAALQQHQDENEAFPVRLTSAYALLSSGENIGLETLIQLMDPVAPEEARKAATFVVATEMPAHLTLSQRERLTARLMCSLQDPNEELALYAAHALGSIAPPSALSSLCAMLEYQNTQIQTVVLASLEEMTHRVSMRRMMLQQALPARIIPLLRSEAPEVRRQASYTFAACGGEYVAAVLGSIVLNRDHPAHVEVIEALRLLHGALRAPLRTSVVRWLLRSLSQTQEDVQVNALDSLAYLLWQARTRGCKQASQEISREIIHDGTVFRLLSDASAWVRQRAIELLFQYPESGSKKGRIAEPSSPASPARGEYTPLPELSMDLASGSQYMTVYGLSEQLLHLLHHDSDSGVRACVAYGFGQLGARWAIPDLLQALLDPDEHVAASALSTLGLLATPEDSIVVYTVRELAHLGAAADLTPSPLEQAARALLKKWRKSARKKHCSDNPSS